MATGAVTAMTMDPRSTMQSLYAGCSARCVVWDAAARPARMYVTARTSPLLLGLVAPDHVSIIIIRVP